MKDLYFIDTHVHLNDETILKHLDEVINDSLYNNVKRLYCVGWDKDSSMLAVELANSFDFVYAIIGFHPCNVKDINDSDYNWLEETAKNNKKVVAIGEIGYDLHWDTTTKEEQEIAFIKQLKIALDLNLPICVHSRDADQITFDTIKNYYKGRGVIHAYSGSVEMANEYIKRGFMLGIGGVLTFKNAKVIKDVVKNIPLEFLVTETDSPYLAPTPHRGVENSPKYIPLICEAISSIKELKLEDVMEQIIINVDNIYK